MRNKLDNKNIELSKTLYDLKQSLDLYNLIAFNADAINKKPGKTFLAHVQRLALKSVVLDFCKIYEEEKRNKLNSISSIIDFIQGNDIKPEYPEIVEEYIKKNGEKVNKKNYSEAFKRILTKFCENNENTLKRLNDCRDSKFAHLEDSPSKNIKFLPSYNAMEKLLFFAIDFSELIYKAYVGVSIDHKTNNRVFVSLRNLLKKIGHTNIKDDFDN